MRLKDDRSWSLISFGDKPCSLKLLKAKGCLAADSVLLASFALPLQQLLDKRVPDAESS